jgi:hypothetical protein
MICALDMPPTTAQHNSFKLSKHALHRKPSLTHKLCSCMASTALSVFVTLHAGIMLCSVSNSLLWHIDSNQSGICSPSSLTSSPDKPVIHGMKSRNGQRSNSLTGGSG